jgi:16S rRNA (guanine527-N7)-methyltransferase
LPGAAGDNHPIARHLLIMTDNAIDPRIALMRSADALSSVRPGEARLLSYLDLIQKWNKVYNLTAVRNPADMVTHHLLDSLAVIAPLGRQLALMRDGSSGTVPVRLLDVGSGAGLPGVVIAICCPEIDVTCVDTVAKKAAFIQQVAAALRLPNLRGSARARGKPERPV